jgi:RNA polymerase sigma factor (sigma-70 family)
MDRYAFVLEQLKDDDFRRLRSYAADDRTKFTTWLTVVSRRLAVDYHRHRYGRHPESQDPSDPHAQGHAIRKRLVDLIPARVDLTTLSDRSIPNPEATLLAAELRENLAEALDRLPARDRLLVGLRFDKNASLAEIADAMGFTSTFQVHRRLKSVLAALRQTLAARGFDEPPA